MDGVSVSHDLVRLRTQFPILSETMRGKKLVYLDNAATAQKPQCVIEAMNSFYLKTNANIHRGVYELSEVASAQYEAVRASVQRFLGTKNSAETIFTSGTTESINLMVSSWGEAHVSAGDLIVVTRLEHHANFVPWQQLALRKKARFVIVEVSPETGQMDLAQLRAVLAEKPKIFAFTGMSNVLGGKIPVAEIAAMAKQAGVALVGVDAAQMATHLPITVSGLGPIDWLAFSGHKLWGPTGTGVLWARESVLAAMTPYRYGGDMIARVGDQETLWNELPWKFEAGTPNIAGVIGMGVALDWVQSVGWDAIVAAEERLTEFALEKLLKVPGVRVLGSQVASERAPVFSFVLDRVHPHDLATYLDASGIAVRAGHHCAQPLLRSFALPASTRASFSFLNTFEEAEYLADVLKSARRYFVGGAHG